MKLRSMAVALTLALASAAASAQSGLYVTMTAQQFTQDGIYANPGTHTNKDQPWLFGPGYGIYYDVTRIPNLFFIKARPLKTGPVVLGIDARGETLRYSEYSSTLNRQDGIFSLRLALKTPKMGTTPYLQGGFGIGHTKLPLAVNYTNNFIYQFGIGADHPIRKHIDWRVVEATAGFLGNYKPGTAPNGSNYLITLGTGLVFRFQ